MKKITSLFVALLSLICVTGCAKKVSYEEFMEAASKVEESKKEAKKAIIKGKVDGEAVRVVVEFKDKVAQIDGEKAQSDEKYAASVYILSQTLAIFCSAAPALKLANMLDGDFYAGTTFKYDGKIANQEVLVCWNRYGGVTRYVADKIDLKVAYR